MNTRPRILGVCIFLSLVCIPTFGQTPKELERKYGNKIEAIEIRPGIMVRLQTGSSGQVAEMRVEPYSGGLESLRIPQTIEADLVKEIIDELAPVEARGKLAYEPPIVIPGGGSWSTYYNYEFVLIRLVHTVRIVEKLPSQAEREREPYSAEVIIIKWKNR